MTDDARRSASGYDAVVFDNDGVLTELTDVSVLRDAARSAFAACGVESPDPDHVERMVLGVTPSGLETVCAAYGLHPESFWAARDVTAAEAQIRETRAGRKELYDDVSVLDELNCPLGIVSTNQQATIDFLLDHHGIGDLFGAAYGREPHPRSLERKKPSPHYVERALSDLGAESALYVGDSESDVRAAHAAGVDAAFVDRPHRGPDYLKTTPEYRLDSLSTLVDLV